MEAAGEPVLDDAAADPVPDEAATEGDPAEATGVDAAAPPDEPALEQAATIEAKTRPTRARRERGWDTRTSEGVAISGRRRDGARRR
jgi:hypothetical protein